MAEAIAKFLQAHPQHSGDCSAGQGHIRYGYGIPSRVRRMGTHPHQPRGMFNIPTFLTQWMGKPILNPAADYFWGN